MPSEKVLGSLGYDIIPGSVFVPSQVRYDWTRRFGTYITVSPSSPYLRRYDWIFRDSRE